MLKACLLKIQKRVNAWFIVLLVLFLCPSFAVGTYDASLIPEQFDATVLRVNTDKLCNKIEEEIRDLGWEMSGVQLLLPGRALPLLEAVFTARYPSLPVISFPASNFRYLDAHESPISHMLFPRVANGPVPSNQRIFDHFDTFIDFGNLDSHRQPIVIDIAQTGLSVLAMTRYLNLWLNNKGSRLQVNTLAISNTLALPILLLGSSMGIASRGNDPDAQPHIVHPRPERQQLSTASQLERIRIISLVGVTADTVFSRQLVGDAMAGQYDEMFRILSKVSAVPQYDVLYPPSTAVFETALIKNHTVYANFVNYLKAERILLRVGEEADDICEETNGKDCLTLKANCTIM